MNEPPTHEFIDITDNTYPGFEQTFDTITELIKQSYDKRLIMNRDKFDSIERICYLSKYLSFSAEKNDPIMVSELSKIIKQEQIDTSNILFYNGTFLYNIYENKYDVTYQVILDTMAILINNAKDKGILRSIIDELSQLENDDIIYSLIKDARHNYNKDELISIAFVGLEYNAFCYDDRILNYLIQCTHVSISDIEEHGKNNLSRTDTINQWLKSLEGM